MIKPMPETSFVDLSIKQPEVICRCDLFGQGQIIISFWETETETSPIPNRWIRFWTQVFFNSKWIFEDQAQSQ